MIKQIDKTVARAMTQQGMVAEEKIEQAVKAVEQSGLPLRTYLIQNQIATEDDILTALSQTYRLPISTLHQLDVETAVLDRIPVRFAWYYKFMPLRIEEKTLIVASAAPLDVKIQDEIRIHLGLDTQTVLVKENEVNDCLNKYYGLAADTLARMTQDPSVKDKDEAEEQEVADLEEGADEATVSRLVNQIILEAQKKRATDIHIEPYRKSVRVRYRIDGSLVDANVPPAVKQFLPSIISRIKIMANLSIVERRRPQDGSAVVKNREQTLDLRISTIPTSHGESMVIRILPTNVTLLSLEKLGLAQKNLQVFRDLVKRPHGIILVTGPTGSGKTTTLYACLNEINIPDRKIITLEDPLEYELEGLTQIQVNPKVDLNFATGLRSILRHDPDIIMVGEIRDLETAEIAIRTALTGHLVFSTLHTNDAASGVTRLVEMGLEPFLVSSSIEAFVAQRLVRIICPECKEEDPHQPEEVRKEIAASLDIPVEQVKIFHGRGCDACSQTGYFGRTAIYEILVVDEDIRSAILEKKRADQIKLLAVQQGMTTLRRNGWQKVVEGMTTPAEVLNVSVPDDFTDSEPPVREDSGRVVPEQVLNAEDDYNARTYERLVEKVHIRYSLVRQDPREPRKLSTEQIEHASVTKDISAGGIRFVSGYTLPLKSILELRIQLDPKEKGISCLARVCRIEDDSLSAMFHIVAYYLDISSADRSRIDQFVQQGLREKNQEKERE